jgi:hypothetical protein
MKNQVVGTYEELAKEYYDPVRHPTCANFRQASDHLLVAYLSQHPFGDGWLCEVGCGDSLIATHLLERGHGLARLVLIDSAPSMLAYSKRWKQRGARLLLADSTNLPLSSESVEFLVSSLGDPYNGPAYWEEVSRVLRRGAVSLFTTPAYEWAAAFRGGPAAPSMGSAEFQLANGRILCVPSWIYPIREQTQLIQTHRLVVESVVEVPIATLSPTSRSPKLREERGDAASVVTGYLVKKPLSTRG